MRSEFEEGWDDTVAQAREGDPSAIARLFQAHRSQLGRLVRGKLGRSLNARVSASDVLQDAYVDVQDRMARYLREPRVPLYVWLRGIVTQRLMKVRRFHIRAARRSITREQARASLAAATWSGRVQLVSNDSSPSERIARRELQHTVRLAVNRLRPLDRKIIIWRQYEGWSNSDVAQALGVTHSAASMRYARALCRLQELTETSSYTSGSE